VGQSLDHVTGDAVPLVAAGAGHLTKATVRLLAGLREILASSAEAGVHGHTQFGQDNQVSGGAGSAVGLARIVAPITVGVLSSQQPLHHVRLRDGHAGRLHFGIVLDPVEQVA
jgi:hypothetical protein